MPTKSYSSHGYTRRRRRINSKGARTAIYQNYDKWGAPTSTTVVTKSSVAKGHKRNTITQTTGRKGQRTTTTANGFTDVQGYRYTKERKRKTNNKSLYTLLFGTVISSKSRRSAKPKNTSQSRTNNYKPAPRTSGQPYIPTAVLEFHSIKMPEDFSTIDKDLCIDIHNKVVNYIEWMKDENDPSYKETIEELSEIIVGLEIDFPDYFPEETALREKKLKKEQEAKERKEAHEKYIASLSIEDKFRFVKNISVGFWAALLALLVLEHQNNIITCLWLSTMLYFIAYAFSSGYYKAEFSKEQKKKFYWFPVKWALIIGPIYTVLDYAYFVFFEYK
jgi:hypothetical protein